MKKLLLLTLIALSLKADFVEPDVIEETAFYKIYCIKGTSWLKWQDSYSTPVQMFKQNNILIPQGCK